MADIKKICQTSGCNSLTCFYVDGKSMCKRCYAAWEREQNAVLAPETDPEPTEEITTVAMVDEQPPPTTVQPRTVKTKRKR